MYPGGQGSVPTSTDSPPHAGTLKKQSQSKNAKELCTPFLKLVWSAQACTYISQTGSSLKQRVRTLPYTEEWGHPSICLGRACVQDWTCSGPQPV